VGPSSQVEGLPRYLEVVRSGLWLIVLTFVLCVGAAVFYLSRAEKVYEATADLFVQPLPRDTPVRIPGVLAESADPTRDVETMARLVKVPSVVRAVKAELDLDQSLTAIGRRVSVEPLAESSILTITAKGSTPERAQALANAFGRQTVEDRTDRMTKALVPIKKALNDQLEPPAGADPNVPVDPIATAQVRDQLAFVNSLTTDPTVLFESRAELPEEAVAPRPVFTLGAAIVGGLALGLLGAFGLSLLDPRLRREEQLRQRFRLPILARVPVEKRRRRKPLLPTELSMGALDSYQALRAALTTNRKNSLLGRTVLVTGPSPGDGKTTSAINLASTLAAAGKRVILIEADARRPSIGRALDMRAERGLASVITGNTYLVDALMPVGGEDSKLRVLLTSPDEAPAADVLSHLAVETLLLQAQKLADWVVVDSPPLNHVAETMTIAKEVDDVLVVVRLGRSNMRDLDELAEMLVQQEIEPAGFVVLGGQARAGYY
jgi:receptor protein-tyrosine kinase